MTLNSLERRNSPYSAFFTEFDSFADLLCHGGWSLSFKSNPGIRHFSSPYEPHIQCTSEKVGGACSYLRAVCPNVSAPVPLHIQQNCFFSFLVIHLSLLWTFMKVSKDLVICPISIAYSMGQIIKSVCVCVCMCVCLSVCEHSHCRISWSIFAKIGTDVRIPKSKNEFVGGQYRTTPSPILPQNPHFRPRAPENPCKY